MRLLYLCRTSGHSSGRSSEHEHKHVQLQRSNTVDSLYGHQKKQGPCSLGKRALVAESRPTPQRNTSLSRSKSCSSAQQDSKSDMCLICDMTVGKRSCHKKPLGYAIPVFQQTTSPARLPSSMRDTERLAPNFRSRLRLFFQGMYARWALS